MNPEKKKKVLMYTAAALALITVILIIRKLNTKAKAPAATGLSTQDIQQVQALVNGAVASAKISAKPAATTSTPKASVASKISSVINPPTYDIGDDVWARKNINATAVVNGVVTTVPFNDSDYIGTFDGLTSASGVDIAWIKTESGLPDNDHFAVALSDIYN